MNIFTKVLLATDGSEASTLAGLAAVELSKRLGPEVHLIYVAREHPYVHPYHDPRHEEEESQFRSEDEQALEEFMNRIHEAGGTIAESHLRVGDPADEIIELAEELEVGLVVVGSRGLGSVKRVLMGSVSTSVLGQAHCSVLIVRGHSPGHEQVFRPGEILVATDGSEEATAAARVATEIAEATDSELHLAYAMQEERYRPHLGPEMWEGWEEGFEHAKRSARSWVEEEARRMLGKGAKRVEPHLVLGRPDAAIVWLAEEIGAGLVVVGSRGLGAMRRALVGSVSDSVAKHAHCPVMVVRKEMR